MTRSPNAGEPDAPMVSELAARLLGTPPRAGRTRVLAVDGRAGSGKSTLATRVAALLEAPVVHMDDLYPGWDGLAAGVPVLVHEVLEPLAAGGVVAHARWDWAASEWSAERVPLAHHGVVVVEGVGCGARAAAPYLSLLVWVELPAAVRRERALARDGTVFARHWDRWAEQEEALLAAEATPARADVVVAAPPPER